MTVCVPATDKPVRTLKIIHQYASGITICNIAEIAPIEAKEAKVLECPTLEINMGVMRHPTINPKKCAEPIRPISIEVKFRLLPDNASRGPKDPLPSWTNRTESKIAISEIIIFIFYILKKK